MSTFESNMILQAIKMNKLDTITDICKVIHSDKPNLIVTEYDGSVPRLLADDDKPTLMLPNKMDPIQESAVVKSIENGEIFDDVDNVRNSAEYIEKTSLPMNALCNKGKEHPKHLKLILTGIVGVMNDEGRFDCDEPYMRNGYNYIKDITNAPKSISDTTCKYYCDNDIPNAIRKEINSIEDDISKMEGINSDDEITDADFEFLNVDEACNCCVNDKDYQEGFLTKRPKKLKPIPRNIISYITIEINAIQDSNDQAMLSGYTCAKLELVDFYLNCIDTQDARYIVPHNRQYLVTMQTELNNLLTKILKIKPINKNDRVWQVNVNYPEGWRG